MDMHFPPFLPGTEVTEMSLKKKKISFNFKIFGFGNKINFLFLYYVTGKFTVGNTAPL